jgi:hypothetical protein
MLLDSQAVKVAFWSALSAYVFEAFIRPKIGK